MADGKIMAKDTHRAGLSVTSKVLLILNSFTPTRPELSLTQICDATGLPAPTAYRLTQELVAGGALERLSGGAYRVGLRLWETGALAPRPRSLRDIARPFMQDLYEATRENVQLAVLTGEEVLYVEKIAGRRAVPVASHVGGRLPLHATGVGKALLASASPSFQERVLRQNLHAYTRHTILMPGKLRQELAKVRREGLATCYEEMTLGTVSIAAPIHDKSGTAAAALSLVEHSFSPKIRQLAPAVQTAARGISRELSASPIDVKNGIS